MNANIPATELGRKLASVLRRVRRQGESFLIEQGGEAVATLEPVGASRGATWRTLTQALPDQPTGDVDFAADLEDVQRNQPEIQITVLPSESTRAPSSRASGNSSTSIYCHVPFPLSGSPWRRSPVEERGPKTTTIPT